MEGYEQDDKGNQIALVGDIIITIGVHGDNICIEQPGDNVENDLIMIFNVDQAKGIIQRLQTFVDSQ